MDFFVALSRTNVEWLKTLVSDAAATMMASQKVNMAMINILKPSVRFDNTAIQQWLDQKAQNIELRTMLKNVKEEKTPTPPKVTGGTPPPRKAPCVNPRRSMSLPVTVKPPLRKKTPVTYQRQTGGPTIPVVKTNRVFRVVSIPLCWRYSPISFKVAGCSSSVFSHKYFKVRSRRFWLFIFSPPFLYKKAATG